MRRRDLLRTGLTAGGGVLAGAGTRAAPGPVDQGFPDTFIWGCATSAYQIEGAVAEDGRGVTNWDVFANTPGRIANGDTARIACDSYHRYADDIRMLHALGVSAYWMTVSWARIFPEGRGQANAKGVDYYDRVVDGLLAAGIEPVVTLFHWELPQALPGGWQNRDTPRAFADYAGYMAGRLCDRVKRLVAVNEVRSFTDLGHQVGIHAPGLKLPPAAVNQVRHHGLLAHGWGTQAIRAHARAETQVGIVENVVGYIPAIETEPHIAAARRATREENAMFFTAIMEGRYLDTYLKQQGADAPRVAPGDMAAIAAPLDFVGLNVYAANWARADDGEAGYHVIPPTESSPRMASPWLVVGPEVGYWTVRHVADLWQPKAMFISENGASLADRVVHDRVDDVDRIMYLRNHLAQFRRAVAEGYPLKGYALWSLMDNFEWADGYAKRFGIHYVDFATGRRIPKLSADWYKEVIRRNALV